MLVVAVAAQVALAACGDEPEAGAGTSTPAAPAPPARAPEYRGTITEVTPVMPVTTDCVETRAVPPDTPTSSGGRPPCGEPVPDLLGRILVEEESGAQRGDKILAAVTRDTVLLAENPAGGHAPIAFDDLRVGQDARVWVDGVVLESYPVQGGASTVVVSGG